MRSLCLVLPSGRSLLLTPQRTLGLLAAIAIAAVLFFYVELLHLSVARGPVALAPFKPLATAAAPLDEGADSTPTRRMVSTISAVSAVSDSARDPTPDTAPTTATARR